jgi:hypothetical protein
VLFRSFEGGWIGSAFLAFLGFAVILLSVLELINFPDLGSASRLFYLQKGGALLSGFALAFMAIQGPRGGNVAIASIAPIAWFCLWLIASHMAHAADPVLLRHAYSFFALAFLLLAFYYVASFAFFQGKVKRYLFCSSAALFFIGVTLGDAHSVHQRGILLVLAATLLIYQLLLSKNLSRPEREEEAPQSDDITEPTESDDEMEKPYWDIELDQDNEQDVK